MIGKWIGCGLALVWCLAGCTEPSVPGDAARTPAEQSQLLSPPMPPPLEKADDAAGVVQDTEMSPASGTLEAAAPGADTQRVPAQVGVGVKGRRLDDPRLVQMIVTPARALFRTRERMVFEVQIPHALQLYEATHGRKPPTHDEFMRQIIQFNQIRLPELPPGQRYVYDPQTGELMVEQPAG